MDEVALFDEMSTLLARAGVEIRVEEFQDPPKNAGGFCKIRGQNLVLLHAGASKPERTRALFEVVERIGLAPLGLSGTDLSAELLSALNRRGNMTWPHKSQAPSLAKATSTAKRTPQPRLCDFTTMQVGGRATEFVEAANEEDIIEAARFARTKGLTLYPLGGGSNVVVSDDGVPGLVLKISATGIQVEQEGGDVLVTAAAGELWHDFAAQMTSEGFAGVECLGGIPGGVGATPIQNVGAYGQEVSQTITNVRVLNRKTFAIENLSTAECQFDYRSSVFKAAAKDQYIVLAATYRLKPGGKPTIRYGELSRVFDQKKAEPPLNEVFNAVLRLRKNKSMVLDPEDENRRSCGSFFVNAQIPVETVARIEKDAGEPPPQFPAKDGLIKVPSAWLIERAGLSKGYQKGYVGLSTKHTLSIVAHEGALAQDIVEFATHVREIVENRFGVRLIPEPHFWGFSKLDDGLPCL